MSSDMFDGMEGHVDRAWSELSRHFFQGNDLIRERMDQIKPGELPPGEETQGVEHLHDLQAAKVQHSFLSFLIWLSYLLHVRFNLAF